MPKCRILTCLSVAHAQVAVHVEKIIERPVEVQVERVVTKEVPVYVDQGAHRMLRTCSPAVRLTLENDFH
jgi:hypothetical protein